VQAHVLSTAENDEVRWIVVQRVPIDVVHDLIRLELPPLPLFDDDTVECSSPTAVLDEPVSLLDPALAFATA